MKLEMKILNISDLHLGESKTTAKHTYNSLREYLSPDIVDITHLFITGDFTHRQLSASSEDYMYTTMAFNFICGFCKKNNIKLRFLEGTPSHDYRQVDILSLNVDDDIDYKYYKDVDIEYDEEYGVYILYVPDEMGDNTAEVLHKINQKMIEFNITEVDIAMMHGSFRYHMPGRLSFDVNSFDFVKRLICIGHNHEKSIVGNIITPGSLERNFFGEEGSKGGYLITLNPYTSVLKILFKENKYSHILNTVNVSACDNYTAMEKLVSELKLKKSKYLRVNTGKNELIDLQLLTSKAKEYGVKLSSVKDVDKNKDGGQLIINSSFEELSITKENITGLILEQIGNTGEDYKELISEIIN